MAAIGDPTRRAIFELLAEGPTPVGELAARLPVSRPAVSQHLAGAQGGGLVTDRAAGTRRLYQLDPTGVAAMRSYLDRFWDQPAEQASTSAARSGQREVQRRLDVRRGCRTPVSQSACFTALQLGAAGSRPRRRRPTARR